MKLKQIYTSSKNIFLKLFLLLVALSFILWGVEGLIGNNQNQAANIDGHIITRTQLAKAKQQEINKLQSMFGQAMSLDFLKQINLDRIVLKKLIDQVVISKLIDELNIIVSNDLVIDKIKKNSLFKDDKNKFNKKIFNRVLQNNSLNEAEYVKSIKQEIAAKMLFDTLNIKHWQTHNLLKQVQKYNNSQAKIDLITIETNIETYKPTKNEIKTKYEQIKYDYQTPEYRSGRFFVIKINENEELFFNKIQQIEDDFAAGLSFHETAIKHQLKIKQFTEINIKGENSLGKKMFNIPNLANNIFSVEIDEEPRLFSDVDDTLFYAIKIEKITAQKFQPLKDLHSKIKQAITKDKVERKLKKIAHDFAKHIHNITDVKNLVNKYQQSDNLTKIKLEQNLYIKRDGHINDKRSLKSDFANEIFKLRSNQFTKPNFTNDNVAIIVKLTEKIFIANQSETHKKKLDDELNRTIPQLLMNTLYKKYSVNIIS